MLTMYIMCQYQSIFFATAWTESTRHPLTALTLTKTPPTIPIIELRNTNQFSLDSTCRTANGVKSYVTSNPGSIVDLCDARVSGCTMCRETLAWYVSRGARKVRTYVVGTSFTDTLARATPLPLSMT